jgi:hypothetical protein
MFSSNYINSTRKENRLEKSKTTINIRKKINASAYIGNYFTYNSIIENLVNQKSGINKTTVMVRTTKPPPPKLISTGDNSYNNKSDRGRLLILNNHHINNTFMNMNLTLQLDEYRKRHGPEKFLDSMKLINIKKWLEEVERVQFIEGKCLDTINKI